MRIVVCPDSFKGSISAKDAAGAMKKGIKRALPDADCVLLPIADGGEGSVAVIRECIGAEWRCVTVRGPYGEPVSAGYALCGEDAYMEMAQASGLCITDRREPLLASTVGTGEMMLDAIRQGARRIIVFIGGSATCDGGIGMAEAIGYRFYDSEGKKLECVGGNMQSIAKIVPPDVNPLEGAVIICASDVTNPTYGENGAACVFAPQKGADPEDVLALDRGLRALADTIERDLSVNVHTLAGGGAAGGLGAGLYAFASAEMRGGFALISETLRLEEQIAHADAVVTGEGCTDVQSIMGKTVGSVAQMAKKHKKKCAVVSGMVRDTDKLYGMGIFRAYSCMDYAPSVEESIGNADEYIALAARKCASEL